MNTPKTMALSAGSAPATMTPPAPDDEQALRRAADTGRIMRMGWLVLTLGLGGFVAWAALAPLDEGVPSQALVTLDTKRKTVQHPNGGIVNAVLVKEGERVREGQVLMRLDGAVSRANFEEIRQRYLGLSATQSRLLAEQSGASEVSFSSEVLDAAAADAEMAELVANQRRLFRSRQDALAADMRGISESIDALRDEMAEARQAVKQRQEEAALLERELSSIAPLVADGYVPRNRQLALERQLAGLRAAMADVRAGFARAEGQIAELRQRQTARQAEYRKEVETELAAVSVQVRADASRFVALQNDLRRIDIRSPADGQVVGLAVQTVGAVVQSGQQLMDIVPTEQALLLEAKIPPHLIDRVNTGLVADIRFAAFAHSPQLVVPGRVLSVSGDLLSEPSNPQLSYFLARVEVTPEGMQRLGERRMQPGMPAEVVIKTGERSMLTYLLHPLLKRVATSMKEE